MHDINKIIYNIHWVISLVTRLKSNTNKQVESWQVNVFSK